MTHELIYTNHDFFFTVELLLIAEGSIRDLLLEETGFDTGEYAAQIVDPASGNVGSTAATQSGTVSFQ